MSDEQKECNNATGKENIDNYLNASKILNDLYNICDWVAEKLGALYIANTGYYSFKGIERKGDRYEITVDWTSMGETDYGNTFTVPADLCERCFCEKTRADAYAELRKIKVEERRRREAEQKAQYEKQLAEQKIREKELRRQQFEELKKEFEPEASK